MGVLSLYSFLAPKPLYRINYSYIVTRRGDLSVNMPRRNPLLFKPEEYSFLHRVYLKDVNDQSKVFRNIVEKKGLGLEETEIMHIKEKFLEWKDKNPKGFLFK